MDIDARYQHVNSIDDLLDAIVASPFEFIHISAHGAVDTENQFKGWWTPEGIGSRSKVAQIKGRVKANAVVSTACRSGTKAFGRYMVQTLGCKYFIAPKKSPRFYNASLFAHVFYHKLFKTQGTVSKAFESYEQNYKNPHKFKLYVRRKS